MINILPKYSDISKEWIDDIFKKESIDDYTYIESEVLNSQNSITNRVSLNNYSKTTVKTFIIKFPPNNRKLKKFFHKLGYYSKEINFYKYFGSDPGINIPKCYSAEIHDETGEFNLVLEDIEDRRKIYPAQNNIKYVEYAIENIAKFHSKWWNDKILFEYNWLHDGRHPESIDWNFKIFKSFIPVMEKHYWKYISDKAWKTVEYILDNWHKYINVSWDGFTLVHGDYHILQIIFSNKNNGNLTLTDWQTCQINWGAIDLARILITGLLPGDRRNHEEELINKYISVLNENGIKDISRSILMQQLRFCAIFSLLSHIITVCISDTTNMKEDLKKHNLRLEDVLFTWPSLAIEDWKSEEAMISLSKSLNKK